MEKCRDQQWKCIFKVYVKLDTCIQKYYKHPNHGRSYDATIARRNVLVVYFLFYFVHLSNLRRPWFLLGKRSET